MPATRTKPPDADLFHQQPLTTPADVGAFDKSPDPPLAGPVSPREGESPRESSSVHRSETSVTSLPLQSRAQRWFHRGTEVIRERVYVALANAESSALTRRAEKLSACCMSPSFYLHADGGVGVGVIRCRDRLCPTCSRARSAKARERAKGAVQRMDAIRFLTLTMPHTDEGLADQLKTLRSAFARLRKSRIWKECVTGGVCTMEITRNARTGQWHPHLHALIDGEFVPHATLREAWRNALNHSVKREWVKPGERVVVDIRATSGRSGAVQYITKYATKPADLSGWGADVIREVADALAGARTLSTFGHLHGIALDPRDPNETPPESSLICNIHAVQMRRREGCPMAEAFVVLVCHACPAAAEFLHPCPARAGPIPDEVFNDAGGVLWLLGRAFVEHAPSVPIAPPWPTG